MSVHVTTSPVDYAMQERHSEAVFLGYGHSYLTRNKWSFLLCEVRSLFCTVNLLLQAGLYEPKEWTWLQEKMPPPVSKTQRMRNTSLLMLHFGDLSLDLSHTCFAISWQFSMPYRQGWCRDSMRWQSQGHAIVQEPSNFSNQTVDFEISGSKYC